MAKPLADRLAAAKDLVARLEAEIVAENLKVNTEVGDKVTFDFGRKDSKRSMSGTVLSLTEIPTKGKVAIVLAGEGAEIATFKVRIPDITQNETADARTAAAAQGDAPVDPLNAE